MVFFPIVLTWYLIVVAVVGSGGSCCRCSSNSIYWIGDIHLYYYYTPDGYGENFHKNFLKWIELFPCVWILYIIFFYQEFLILPWWWWWWWRQLFKLSFFFLLFCCSRLVFYVCVCVRFQYGGGGGWWWFVGINFFSLIKLLPNFFFFNAQWYKGKKCSLSLPLPFFLQWQLCMFDMKNNIIYNNIIDFTMAT